MELENLSLIDGCIPKRCRELVREWAERHQNELVKMWNSQKFHTIAHLK